MLGLTWVETGEAPDWQRLYERREAWPIGTVPSGGLFLTASADVQRDRIEVDVWAWGRGLESWLVEHIVLDGDTSRSDVWDRLTGLLDATWPHECGARMRLARLAVDSGDGLTTAAVYGWVRKAGPGQALAVKGVHGFDRTTPVDGPKAVDVNEAGKRLRRGVSVWKVSVAVFKSETYRCLRLDRPTDEEMAAGGRTPDGFVHIPLGTTAEWIRQLVPSTRNARTHSDAQVAKIAGSIRAFEFTNPDAGCGAGRRHRSHSELGRLASDAAPVLTFGS